jgi:transposase
VQSVRNGNKVRQKIVRYVGVAMDDDELQRLMDLAEHIKAKLESDYQLSLFSPEEAAQQAIAAREENTNKPLHVDLKQLKEEQRIVMGIHEVYGKLYQELGFQKVFSNTARQAYNAKLLFEIVMARIANPKSKRGSIKMLEQDFGVSLPLHKVYRMMDALGDKVVKRIQDIAYSATMDLLKKKVNILFYDCTTLYFESFIDDELKQNGYSKDCKFNQPQVLLALIVTEEGLPLGYEVFPGSCFEGHTLIPVLKGLRERFELEHVIFVGDRGMISKENLAALEAEKFKYIVGAKLRNLSKDMQKIILDEEKRYVACDDNKYAQRIAKFEQEKGRTLLVSYSAKRAAKDKLDREKAITKLLKKLSKSKNPKSLLSNYGYKKFIAMKGESKLYFDQEKLEEEAKWDGLHGVITNVKDMSSKAIITHYRELYQVEECFRISKHDLKIRPIFHWVPPRVKAHIAISFMTLVCVRHLEYRVALQYQKLSPEIIRNELLHVQLTFLKHNKSNKQYCVPSKVGQDAKKIYQVMGLKLATIPFQVI